VVVRVYDEHAVRSELWGVMKCGPCHSGHCSNRHAFLFDLHTITYFSSNPMLYLPSPATLSLWKVRTGQMELEIHPNEVLTFSV
jgi:hypothetical protein